MKNNLSAIIAQTLEEINQELESKVDPEDKGILTLNEQLEKEALIDANANEGRD